METSVGGIWGIVVDQDQLTSEEDILFTEYISAWYLEEFPESCVDDDGDLLPEYEWLEDETNPIIILDKVLGDAMRRIIPGWDDLVKDNMICLELFTGDRESDCLNDGDVVIGLGLYDFPLPKDYDIPQALAGAEWLTWTIFFG